MSTCLTRKVGGKRIVRNTRGRFRSIHPRSKVTGRFVSIASLSASRKNGRKGSRKNRSTRKH
jgi:hypothetical protein